MEDVYYNPSDPGCFGDIKRLKERYHKKGKTKGNGSLFKTRTPYTNLFANRSLDDTF